MQHATCSLQRKQPTEVLVVDVQSPITVNVRWKNRPVRSHDAVARVGLPVGQLVDAVHVVDQSESGYVPGTGEDGHVVL